MAFGKSETQRLYVVWMNMHNRCKDINHQAHKNYGARGISICKEWSDVNAFREWAIKNGYEYGLTLDRRDNNGNYSPEICRFVTRIVNASNQRSRKNMGGCEKCGNRFRARITINGKRIKLGTFSSKDESMARYLEAHKTKLRV